jgi:hypothetical protein
VMLAGMMRTKAQRKNRWKQLRYAVIIFLYLTLFKP